jgi:hypothetical protein
MTDSKDATTRAAVELTIKTWRETSEWGKYFFPCPYNWSVLFDKLQHIKGPLTVDKLDKATWLLSTHGWDLTKDADPNRGKVAPVVDTPELQQQRAQQEQAARELKEQQEAEAEKQLFATWEAGLPGMNPLQRLQYSHAMKDNYMKRKYPRTTPDTAPAASTIRNSNQQILMEKARAERQAQARNTPPIQPHNTGARGAFGQAQEARAREEADKK